MSYEMNLLVGLIIGVPFFAVMYWMINESHRRLDDPDDKSAVYTEQLADLCALAGDRPYMVQVIRQSGNVQSEKVYPDRAAAVAAVLGTLRRAKIDGVWLKINTDSHLLVNRLYHDHRGSNEGRKVGGVQVVRIG